MTAEAILEQKASFIIGMIGSSNGMTKEKIKQIILKSEGRAAPQEQQKRSDDEFTHDRE